MVTIVVMAIICVWLFLCALVWALCKSAAQGGQGMMKHVYYCHEKPTTDEDGGGFAVVATSSEEALVISDMEYADDLLLDGDAEELPIGKVDDFEGLRRQIYGSITGKCPNCDNPNETESLFYDEDSGRFYCGSCNEIKEGEFFEKVYQ